MRRVFLRFFVFCFLWGAPESSSAAFERASSARSRFTIDPLVRTIADGKPALSPSPNEACTKAHLARVEFKHLAKFESDVNFCEVPVASLPVEVRALIEKIGGLNEKVATLLDQDPRETFAMGVEIQVSASDRGSIGSEFSAGRVVLDALPDWTLADFSAAIYVHELVHLLMFNTGPTADALVGLQDHPLLVEAFPDLIATTLQGSPKMELVETDLPKCLRSLRDEVPVHGYDAPFSRFYALASSDSILACCAKLDRRSLSPFATRICETAKTDRSAALAKARASVDSDRVAGLSIEGPALQARFVAEHCRIRTATGLVYLDGCDTHQFAYPLVSFFFRLRELTGRDWVAAFYAKIREGVTATAVYECGFTRETEGGKSYIGLRPLLGPFMALRESMAEKDRAAFDLAWKEHDFAKMIDLDRLFRSEGLAGLAQIAVKERNPLYRKAHACGNVYDFAPIACGVTCVKLR